MRVLGVSKRLVHLPSIVPFETKLLSIFGCCNCLINFREFKPYSRIPKKYLKQKDRNKKNRDDVYFLTDQTLPKHTLQEAIDTLRAYDLFGSEPIDLILKLNLGQGKVSF